MNDSDRNLLCEHHHFSSRHSETIARLLVERAHLLRHRFVRPMSGDDHQSAGAELAHLIAHLHILYGIQVEATCALIHALYRMDNTRLIHSLLNYRSGIIHRDLQELLDSPDPVKALFHTDDTASPIPDGDVELKALLRRLKDLLEHDNAAHRAYNKSKHGLLLFRNPEILPNTDAVPDLKDTEFESDAVFVALEETDRGIHYARIPLTDEQSGRASEDEFLKNIQEMAKVGREIAQRIPH